MDQESKFIFGNGYFVFFGLGDQNDLHHNAACQIIISAEHAVSVSDENNNSYVGQIVLIKPLTRHTIQCDGPMSAIYLSPDHTCALSFINELNEANIGILDDEALPFSVDSSLEQIVDILNSVVATSKTNLDPRLLAAMDDISANLLDASISETAGRCNLSRSRLRTLAREQIGMPLSTWLMWRKIVESNKALSRGASLSEAALAGGFSDQAHFTRTMKRMFGVTPARALRIYT